MFTENKRVALDPAAAPARPRGRPRGRTLQGLETRRRLYQVAVQLIAARGWQATTLRDVAQEAGVSVGLLYRYFPSKRAIVLELYDELSAEYAARAAQMRPGRWRDRALEALTTSLAVLQPQRSTLAAMVSVLVGDANEGLFAPGTAFSRLRVQAVFVAAVVGARDAPGGDLGPALGRLLYLLHLAIILFWLLDRSPAQRTTQAVLGLLASALRLAAPALHVPGVPRLLITADALVREALFADPPSGITEPLARVPT